MRTAFKYLPERAGAETRVGKLAKVSPSPTLFLAICGGTGNKTCGRSQQKSLKPQWFQGFFFCLEAILALHLALFLRQTLDEPLHTVSTAASHLFCHMTIDIQRKRCCVMTKVFLHCLDVIAAL